MILCQLQRSLGVMREAESATLNTYMTAHISESRARIQKALNAELDADR